MPSPPVLSRSARGRGHKKPAKPSGRKVGLTHWVKSEIPPLSDEDGSMRFIEASYSAPVFVIWDATVTKGEIVEVCDARCMANELRQCFMGNTYMPARLSEDPECIGADERGCLAKSFSCICTPMWWYFPHQIVEEHTRVGGFCRNTVYPEMARHCRDSRPVAPGSIPWQWFVNDVNEKDEDYVPSEPPASEDFSDFEENDLDINVEVEFE